MMDSRDISGDNGKEPAPDISHIIIEHQQKEIEKLREQLTKSKRVEITGEGGSPVYATGSVQDGHWRSSYGRLWEVSLEMARPHDDDVEGSEVSIPSIIIPISALEGIEIRLGGVLYASATSHHVDGSMTEHDWDNDMGKEVWLHFGGDVGAWLPIRISDWPRSHWSIMKDLDDASRRNDTQPLDVFDTLRWQVTTLYPNANISFNTTAFFGRCVNQKLKDLGLGQISEEEKEQEEEASNMRDLIATHLREAGSRDLGNAWRERVSDVLQAAYMMESQKVAEAVIPTLAEMQLASQSTADFLSEVQERYKGILRNPSGNQELSD